MKKGMNQKTNLLFILQTFRTGGSERIVKDLCENLDPDKFNCFVVALVGGEMEKEFRDAGIPAHCVHKKGRDARKIMAELSGYVKSNRIDVVNAHHFSPFFHGLYGARINGAKIFFTGHTCPEIDSIGMFWSWVGTVLLHLSDGAIGISEDVSHSIVKKFRARRSKVSTIVNAVNHKRFEIEIDVGRKRQELGILDGERIVGSVGSLGQQKNYPNLLKAFKILRGQMSDVKLLIVGEGKRREELSALIRSLGLEGKALLLGARLDVPELMKIMDVYCLASFYEGLPLTILEAMAAGVPIVATDVIGINEVVHHEKTGLLVAPDNPQELAEGLMKVLRSPGLGKDLAENARKYVIEKHGMTAWIGKYERLFLQ
jgi:glycosyltransferase involved in cell wall biosynthesis